MKRCTYKALQQDAKIYSHWLVASGSPYHFKASHRNGYSAIDLYVIDGNGKRVCSRMVQGGTPKECLLAMETEYRNLYGKKSIAFEVTRRTAKTALSFFLNFNKDFHEQTFDDQGALEVWAKVTKYRKPKNANGSLSRYFFYHLAKIKEV